MNFGLLFTIGALVYTIAVAIIYFSKDKISTVRTKIYSLMLIIIISMCTVEIIAVSLMSSKYELLANIFWKLHWALYFSNLLVIFSYSYIAFNNISEQDMKKFINSKPIYKIFAILFLIIPFVYCIFTKYVGLEDGIIDFFPTKLDLIGSFGLLAGIYIAITIMYILNRKKSNKYNLTILITFLIISVLGTVFSLFFRDTAFYPFACALEMFFLYLLVENPDIYILNEIDSARGDIEKSNQTKTDFLSNMTYEIKVPMNLIVSLCDELINMQNFDEKVVREDISQIASSGNNLLDIVNNILDISKIETGKENLQEREYKINDMLTDLVGIAKSKIGSKPVKLVVNIDQNISSILKGDSAKLYQSLMNIVANAAKYTDVGRITFTVTSNKTNGVEKLTFKITDTGTGIKDEDKELLFVKGNRLDNATEGEIEGSGLGLVITKEYIDSLGGKIWFESQYCVGTTFYVEVPQAIIDETPIGNVVASSSTEEKSEKLDCSAYTVLVVDDNNLNIKVAKRLLEAYKFNVESVTTGKDCVYKVKEDTHYDMIFMDHMMPEMDGIETLHVLQKLDGYKLPPIIALTANAIAGMKEMYLQEGFDEYLSKPINTTELDRIVNKFFKK